MFGDRTGKHMKVVNAYIEPILQEALKKKKLFSEEMGGEWEGKKAEGKEEIRDDETLLDHLVKLTDGKICFLVNFLFSESLSPLTDATILKDETLNIMIAGRDTVRQPLYQGKRKIEAKGDLCRLRRRSRSPCTSLLSIPQYSSACAERFWTLWERVCPLLRTSGR
jgi:hypothetical protein